MYYSPPALRGCLLKWCSSSWASLMASVAFQVNITKPHAVGEKGRAWGKLKNGVKSVSSTVRAGLLGACGSPVRNLSNFDYNHQWRASGCHVISSLQSLSRVWLFATPWPAARQASLSVTDPQSLLRSHIHRVSDAIQPSHALSSPSPPAFNLSQHQGLFQWISSLYQVAKVLELQHQSFQWIFRTDFQSEPKLLIVISQIY